jgi:hypothetical protein
MVLFEEHLIIHVNFSISEGIDFVPSFNNGIIFYSIKRTFCARLFITVTKSMTEQRKRRKQFIFTYGFRAFSP